MKRLLLIVVGLSLLGAAVVGIFLATRQHDAGRPAKLTFRLDWAPGAEHSFLYLARDAGYFKAEGLDVEIQAGDGSTTAAKLVGNGSVDYALCSGDSALIGATAGVPLKVLAVLYAEPPTVIYSRKDRNITKPKDLEGRKYGAYFKSTTYKQFLAFCQATGIDVAKLQVVSTAGKAEDILTDSVDASGGYTYIQPVQCDIAGIPINEMWVSDFGVKCYSMSIIANSQKLDPETAKRVLKAVLRAFGEMSSGNPAAMTAFLKANPTGNQEFETRKLAKLRAFLARSTGQQTTIGYHDLDGWTQTQTLLLSQGLVEKKIALSHFFTTEYLPLAQKQ